MATPSQAPDPKAFKSWEDAFSFPIPAVRRMEQQLRTDISTNRERLRSLVGGSYRDLLGTADTIIDMDGRMQGVEALVGRIGRRCNAGLLERTKQRSDKLMKDNVVVGGTELDAATGGSKPERRPAEIANGSCKKRRVTREEYVLASHLALFKSCPPAIQRVLKHKQSLLVAAKIFVISRLLYKQLREISGSAGGAWFQGIVEQVSGQLSRVRSRLIAAVDNRLGKLSASTEDLIDALSAYALAETASAADVLKHFYKVRAASMTHCMHIAGDIAEKDHSQRPIQALKIWLRTLQDTPMIFPRQLSQALSRLKTESIIKNAEVRDVSALELDIHQNWLGTNITEFVPYIRHDDLDVAAAKKQMSSWAPASFQKYLKDLEAFLQPASDLKEVARLRTGCLTAWFSGSGRISGIPRSEVLEKLRTVFAEKLASMTGVRCDNLQEVTKSLRITVEEWPEGTAEPLAGSLWDADVLETDVSHGAKRFTRTLRNSLQGRTRAVDECLRRYKTWQEGIEEAEAAIREQRKLKWQDLSDDFLDADDYDEEDSRDQLLSKEDPDALQRKLEQSVALAIEKYHKELEQLAKGVADTSKPTHSASTANQKAAFLLRFLREALLQLPTSYKGTFGTTFTSALYQPLVRPITAKVAHSSQGRISKSLQKRQLAVRALWSNETELPILPSPWAVRLVRDCQSAMESAGTDLWTVSAVDVLKSGLTLELSKVFDKARDTAAAAAAAQGDGDDGAEKKENEDEKDAKAGGSKKDESGPLDGEVCIQQIFDVLYLSTALRPSSSPASSAAEAGQQKAVRQMQNDTKGAKKDRQDDEADASGDSGDAGLEKHIQFLQRTAHLGDVQREQLASSAAAYWKRTTLLFALLR